VNTAPIGLTGLRKRCCGKGRTTNETRPDRLHARDCSRIEPAKMANPQQRRPVIQPKTGVRTGLRWRKPDSNRQYRVTEGFECAGLPRSRNLEHVDSPEAVGGHDEQSALSRAKGRTSPLSAAALSIEAQARRTDRAAAGCCASCTPNAKISSAGMDGTKRLNLS
jgi:hypothetical protein